MFMWGESKMEKKVITSKKIVYYPQEKDNWCIYACMQMLLEFSNIYNIKQSCLYNIHFSKGEHHNNKTFIDNLNPYIGDKIEYVNDIGLKEDRIKNIINIDAPVCVNLYLVPPKSENESSNPHALIFYGYDDFRQVFFVIDPQPQNGRGNYYEMTYLEYKEKDKNRLPGFGKEIFFINK